MSGKLPRSMAIGITMLLGLSLLLAACGDGGAETSLKLATGSPAATEATQSVSAASSPASATTGATTATSAVAGEATATPVIIGTPRPLTTANAQVGTTSASTSSAATPRATVGGTSPASPATPRPASTTPATRPSPAALKPVTGFAGKLSFLGTNETLYIARFDGSAPQLVLGKPGLTPGTQQDGEAFRWPTWSRDGSKLAVMGFNYKGGTIVGTDIFVVGADGKNPVKVQENNPEAPVYISWSPDGNLLSLLLSRASQPLELRVLEAAAGKPTSPRKIAEGTAIFSGWSPDSQQLLYHSTTPQGNNSVAVVAAKDAKAAVVALKGTFSNFRTPAFSQDGARLAVAILNGQRQDEIIIQDKAGTQIGRIEVGGTGASFAWSPGGNKLAHTYSAPNSQGLNRTIAISEIGATPPADGKFNPTLIVKDDVVGFFWSPDGKKLAYSTYNEQSKLLVWNVYDLATSKSTPLVEWVPSDNTLQLLSYYDQYSQSNTVWSPDSKAITFSGYSKDDVAAIIQSGDTENAVPMVYIVPTEGGQVGQALPIAPGELALWGK